MKEITLMVSDYRNSSYPNLNYDESKLVAIIKNMVDSEVIKEKLKNHTLFLESRFSDLYTVCIDDVIATIIDLYFENNCLFATIRYKENSMLDELLKIPQTDKNTVVKMSYSMGKDAKGIITHFYINKESRDITRTVKLLGDLIK